MPDCFLRLRGSVLHCADLSRGCYVSALLQAESKPQQSASCARCSQPLRVVGQISNGRKLPAVAGFPETKARVSCDPPSEDKNRLPAATLATFVKSRREIMGFRSELLDQGKLARDLTLYGASPSDPPSYRSASCMFKAMRSSVPMVREMCPFPVESSSNMTLPGSKGILRPPATSISPLPLRTTMY